MNYSEMDKLEFSEFLQNNEQYCKLYCVMPQTQRLTLIKQKTKDS